MAPSDVKPDLNIGSYHYVMEPTGHSRQLRERLRVARETQKLSQRAVGAEVAARLGREKPYTGAVVSLWEKFEAHPPIDTMAVWARVVGLRLVVELDSVTGGRVPVLLRPRAAAVARLLDLLTDDELAKEETYLDEKIRRAR